MAVARPELTPNELEWVITSLKSLGKPPREYEKGLRQLEVTLRKAREVEKHERAQLARRRAAMRTDPANYVEWEASK